MGSPAIRVENVRYTYPAAIDGAQPPPALQAIDLVVETGEFLAIMGPTGAGKTTLCLALNGLVPQSTGGRFRGDVWIADRNTKVAPVAELATEVGLVFQDSESQLFSMTVEDEVAFGLENLGLPVEEIERRIQWALDVVGLADKRAWSPAHLSGGQQRRLAIAAVLAMKPTLLVLDEPTAGLDPLGSRAVLEVIAELHRQGTTVLMATQDAEDAATLARRVVVMEAGQIVLDGPAQNVLGQVETLNALGVDAPQMAELSLQLGIHPPCLTVHQASQTLSENWSRQSLHSILTIEALQNPWFKAQATGSRDVSDGAARSDDGRTPTTPIDDAPSGQPAVVFQDVWYRYEEGAQALAGIDFTINAGEYIALIGANGSGKSTLAKHVNGLLRPQQGRVLVAGNDTREKSTGELARLVGYVFQNPDHQIFAPSVREEIAFGPRNLGLSPAEVEKRVEAAMAAFDLVPLADLPPATLGYGQRRLVTLAAVHAMEPQVLILDEPTVGLDRSLTTRLVEWVSQLHRSGATVILITHDMRLTSLASRCVVMNGGRTLLDVSTARLFEHPERIVEAGILPPPLVELRRRLDLPLAALSRDTLDQPITGPAGETRAL